MPMRKGAKRKRVQKDKEEEVVKASSSSQDNHKQESTKAPTRAKRVKASKPQSEPEYFEDKRNLVIFRFA